MTVGPTKMRPQARSSLARRSQMLRRHLRMTVTMAKSAAMMVRLPEGLSGSANEAAPPTMASTRLHKRGESEDGFAGASKNCLSERLPGRLGA